MAIMHVRLDEHVNHMLTSITIVLCKKVYKRVRQWFLPVFISF